MKREGSYGEVRIALPAFVILALRLMAKEADALTIADIDRLAAKSPELKDAAEAWLRAPGKR
jgi:hypothetical protein